MQYQNTKKNKGFVLLYAVTLAALLLSIALGVGSVALKEINFSTSIKDADNAFYAADTGAEQALFNDKSPGYPSSNFIVSGLGSDGQSCANVSVDKSVPPTVIVTANGYNIGSAGGSCTSTNPNRVERELKTTYGNPTAPLLPQTPLRTLSQNNGIMTISGVDVNLGYRFTPNTNGSITQLALRTANDSLPHTVTLYDISGNTLASTTITAVPNTWVTADITSVGVTSGMSYVVAVRTNVGVYYENGITPPQTTGNITINEGRYILGSSLMPSNVELTFYGEADVTFVPN